MHATSAAPRLSSLRHLSVRVRLTIGFGSIVILLVASAALGVAELRSLTHSVIETENRNISAERLIAQWRMATQAHLPLVMAVTLSVEREAAALFGERIDRASGELSALQARVETMLDEPTGRAALADVVARQGEYLAMRQEIAALHAAASAPEVARRVREQLLPAVDAYLASQAKLADAVAEARSARVEAAQSGAEIGQLFLVAFAALGAAAAIVLGAMIARSIAQPVRRTMRAVDTLATGNLRERIAVHSRSEFGRMLGALEAMRAQFERSLGEVQQAARVVEREAKDLARGSVDLASRTEEQASTLEETASTMEEFSAAVKQSAESARQASELARHAEDVARRGGEAVSAVMSTMDGIAESSGRISEIVGVIDSIAFQTNILALNAAVEAARAGDQGRGFAVVASEVRALAQRSAGAAKEIKSLIADSAERVGEGARRVIDAGGTMTEVVEAVNRVNGMIAEISVAAQEQKAGIDQVSLAVTQMDRATQENAALVERSADTAQNMTVQAEILAQSIARFTIGEAPTAAPAPQHAPAPQRRVAPPTAGRLPRPATLGEIAP